MEESPEQIEKSASDEAALLFARDKTLLIVDDDRPFLNRLSKAMTARGFVVSTADTVTEALAYVRQSPPAFAVIDMRLTDGNGLDVITELKTRRPEARAIILTGYGNISSAVIAIKLGAFDYLAKPADADEIFLALMNGNEALAGTAPRELGRTDWIPIFSGRASRWPRCFPQSSSSRSRLSGTGTSRRPCMPTFRRAQPIRCRRSSPSWS